MDKLELINNDENEQPLIPENLSDNPKATPELDEETFRPEETEDDFEDDYDNYEDEMDHYGESYEKYGGYNGYSDDVIDDAFEGDPMNTWNVD